MTPPFRKRAIMEPMLNYADARLNIKIIIVRHSLSKEVHAVHYFSSRGSETDFRTQQWCNRLPTNESRRRVSFFSAAAIKSRIYKIYIKRWHLPFST
jgi:hypothetical protein